VGRKVIEVWAGGNEEPPSPNDIFTKCEQTGKISGLRNNKKIYMKFLQNFAKTVYGKSFGVQSKSNMLSTYLPSGLEGFLVLAYTNGYEVWKSEGIKRRSRTNTLVDEDDSTDTNSDGISDLSSEAQNHRPKYKFTANGRGSKTGEGWTAEGLALYNGLASAICMQRKDLTSGATFESEFLNYTMTNASQRRTEDEEEIDMHGDWGVVNTDYLVSQSADVSDPDAEEEIGQY